MDGPDLVVDGEVVGLGGGSSSFARLQGRMKVVDRNAALSSGIAVAYYVFDILWFDGWDVTSLPLRERKALLRGALTFRDPIRFTPHRNARGKPSSGKPAARDGRA